MRNDVSGTQAQLESKAESVDPLRVPAEEEQAIAVSVERAAHLIGVSRALLYQHIETGLLPSFRLGRLRRVRVSDLQAFVDRLVAQQQNDVLKAQAEARRIELEQRIRSYRKRRAS